MKKKLKRWLHESRWKRRSKVSYEAELRTCPFSEPCCMRRDDGRCVSLTYMDFPDGECHFRKLTRNGENLYDKERRKKDD